MEKVNVELRSSELSAEKYLLSLCSHGLIERIDGKPVRYAFHTRNSELAEVVAELAETYQGWKFAVIQLIFDKPSLDLRDFADAFKLKKKEED